MSAPLPRNVLRAYFGLTFEADLWTWTCGLCGARLAYTDHATDETIDADLTAHLRGAHSVPEATGSPWSIQTPPPPRKSRPGASGEE